MSTNELLYRFATALAIGLLIGLERGWRDRDEKPGQRAAGIRTFSLVALFGALTGAMSLGGDRLLLAVSVLTLGVTLGAFLWREGERDDDLSATSMVAGLVTFALGALAVLGDLHSAVAGGVATAVLLASKHVLHGWLQRLRWTELQSILQLAAMSFIVLPLLPQRFIDPWNSINPYQLWLMTISLAAVSFVGYVASRLAGEKLGLLVAAMIGGMFASTAVTLTLARQATGNFKHDRMLAGGIVAAGAIMVLRVVVICGFANFSLARQLANYLIPAAAAMSVIGILFLKTGPLMREDKQQTMVFANPFDLVEVLRFGLLLAGVFSAVTLAQQHYGQSGLMTVAFLSGLVDVDAMTLSAARLSESPDLLMRLILLTVASNSLAKVIYAGVIGGARLGLLSLFGTAAGFAAATFVFLLNQF